MTFREQLRSEYVDTGKREAMPDHIDVELKDIRDMLAELCVSQREHGIEQRVLKEDIAQIKHVLIEGNGQPAMTVRLAIVENELKRVTEERNDRKMPRAAWLAILISALLSSVGIVLTVAKLL